MTCNLVKLSVGVDDVGHLARIQERRLKQQGVLEHITRNTPKRSGELLQGGSIYWVIRKFIRVHQRLLGVERRVDEDGRPFCALIIDPRLVMTELQEFRAFQGWRYFDPKDAPPDLGEGSVDDDGASLPDGMATELRGLGLL